MIRTVFACFLICLVPARIPAQARENDVGHEATDQRENIHLTLKASRAQTASDTSFAVSAEIENTTNKAIFINSNLFSLAIPPEVDPAPDVGGISEWYAFFPGIGQNNVVALQPGSRTVAIFSLPKNPKFLQRFRAALRLVPGEYTVHAVCAYWTDIEDARARRPNYMIQHAQSTMEIVAPPLAILTGAGLGGLIAFLLLPTLWLPATKTLAGHGWVERAFIICRGLVASSLLSVIVAILLSRVSDSQFLVKVSIQDFWGAVAIGFIVGASGTSILQRWNLSQARQGPQGETSTASTPRTA